VVRLRISAFCAAISVLLCGGAFGQTTTNWTRDGDTTRWSDSGNWDTPPIFNSGTATQLTFNLDNFPETTINSFVDVAASIDTLTILGTSSDEGLNLTNGGGSLVIATSLIDASSNPVSISVPISGNGTLTVNGAGTLTLSGANTYTGQTMIIGSGSKLVDGAAGSFSANSSIALSSSGSLSVNFAETINGLSDDGSGTVCINGANLVIGGSSSNAFGGTIMGSGSLEIGGTATEVLYGSNTYEGNTTVDLGATLQLGNGINTGTIETSVIDNGSLVFMEPTCITFNDSICGTGNVDIVGGMVQLTASNTYSGLTTVQSGGILEDGEGGSFSPFSGLLVLTNGSVVMNGSETVNGLGGDASAIVTLNNEGAHLLTTANGAFAGTITGNGSFEVGTGVTQVLTGQNNYTSGTTIDSLAILQLGDGTTNGMITGGVSDMGTLEFNFSGPDTFCGSISGSGAVIVENGTAVFMNSNSYSGGTTIDATGTLQLGNGDTAGSITGSVFNAGTLSFEEPSCVTFCGAISGPGNVLVNGGMVTLMGGEDTYTGQTMVENGGKLVDGGPGSFSAASLIYLVDGGKLSVNYNEAIASLRDDGSGTVCIADEANLAANGNGTFGGTIMGGGSFEIGAGIQTLLGDNTYTGGTTIDSSATLRLGNGGEAGSIMGGVTNNGTLEFNRSGSVTFCGPISGSGNVTLDDSVTVTLMGENSYSGSTLLDAGATLYVTNNSSLGSSLVVAFGGNPTLAASGGNVCLSNNILVPSTGLTLNTPSSSNTLMLSGTISDSSSFGQLFIAGPVTLSGSNTYTGGTTITDADLVTVQTNTGLGTGTVSAFNSDVVFNGSAPVLTNASFEGNSSVTFSGNPTLTDLALAESTLNFYGSTATLIDMASDTGGSDNQIELGEGTQLTFQVSSDNDVKYHGTISGDGDGGIVLTGGGELDLKSANFYSGPTIITSGVLVASDPAALGTGSVTVNGAGSALGVDTGVSLANAVTLNGGALGGYGTFSNTQNYCIANGSMVVGGSGTVGNMPAQGVVGNLTFATGSTLTLGGGGIMQFSVMNATGTAGTDYSLISADSVNVTATSGTPFTISVVSVNPSTTQLGVANFNALLPYSWTILTAASGITNFNAAAFTFSTANFSNSLNGGTFAVTDVGGDSLVLNFTPVPEPSTWALMAAGVFAIGGVAIRRRRRA